ncbi:MAG: hypothetical protein WC263_00195 [Candidatus Micrarchaeia archaeon]|jgi:predicted  nucleic acid-binding Zn-ribbon protein
MHKCSKCGRAATSLEEIDAGCPCGSKVFIFDRQIAQAVSAPAAEGNGDAAGAGGIGGAPGGFAGAGGNGGNPAMAAAPGNGAPAAASIESPSTFAVPETAKGRPQEIPGSPQEGKVPESYHARTTFTGDDIENIKVLTQGVFILDVNAISKNPVVLKDEDEIYYVKLPLVQKKAPEPLPGGNGGNGKRE